MLNDVVNRFQFPTNGKVLLDYIFQSAGSTLMEFQFPTNGKVLLDFHPGSHCPS